MFFQDHRADTWGVILLLVSEPAPLMDTKPSFAFIPKGRSYKVLGTDGFGRSDFRYKLRHHFEIDRYYIVVAALMALADEGTLPAAKVADELGIGELRGFLVNR